MFIIIIRTHLRSKMAEVGRQDEEAIKRAFKAGDKILAENLLPRVSQPSGIMVTFDVYMLRAASVISAPPCRVLGLDGVLLQRFLVKYGMAANREDNKGHIPLHYAACNGHLYIVQYLIRVEYCNPSCEDYDGKTPLHYACDQGHLNIVLYLIREDDIVTHHVKTTMAKHPFTMLVIKVTSTLFSISSERNIVIHRVKNCNGKTPLHYACDQGHLNTVQYLIREEHCNPSCEDYNGKTPLPLCLS